MDEILNAANELGLLIRKTGIFIKFNTLSEKLELDQQSVQLLNEYLTMKERLRKMETGGDIDDFHDIDRLQRLYELVSKNDLLMDFIDARDSYIKLLSEIQESIM